MFINNIGLSCQSCYEKRISRRIKMVDAMFGFPVVREDIPQLLRELSAICGVEVDVQSTEATLMDYEGKTLGGLKAILGTPLSNLKGYGPYLMGHGMFQSGDYVFVMDPRCGQSGRNIRLSNAELAKLGKIYRIDDFNEFYFDGDLRGLHRNFFEQLTSQGKMTENLDLNYLLPTLGIIEVGVLQMPDEHVMHSIYGTDDQTVIAKMIVADAKKNHFSHWLNNDNIFDPIRYLPANSLSPYELTELRIEMGPTTTGVYVKLDAFGLTGAPAILRSHMTVSSYLETEQHNQLCELLEPYQNERNPL
jgi:hypothetical protein